jgi:ribonuclease P protein component
MVSSIPEQPSAEQTEKPTMEFQLSSVKVLPKKTPMASDQCFPPHARLLTGRDFQVVFKGTEGRSSDQSLTVLAKKNEHNQARLGLAISKRFIKTAVGRNRVKRLVRDSFRRHQSLLAGLDIVVINRIGAHTTSNQALTKALEAHWRRVAKRCVKS